MTVPKKKPVYVPKKILPATDPRWEEATRPLLDFLSEPRTWDVLLAWGKRERVPQDTVRNMLAWLSLNKHATYNVSTRLWMKT